MTPKRCSIWSRSASVARASPKPSRRREALGSGRSLSAADAGSGRSPPRRLLRSRRTLPPERYGRCWLTRETRARDTPDRIRNWKHGHWPDLEVLGDAAVRRTGEDDQPCRRPESESGGGRGLA